MRLLASVLMLLSFSSAVIADDRVALEAAAQAWTKAVNAGDANALLSLSTDDIVLLNGNDAPIRGSKAARDALLAAARRTTGQLTTATKEIAVAGDIAWRVGSFARQQPDGEVSHGQSLEIWQRVNTRWKLHRQMSSNLLAPPPITRPPRNEPVLDTPSN